MKTRVTLTFLPPSVNAMYRHTKSGRTYRTRDYMAWLNGEAWNVSTQLLNQHRFTGPVFLTVAMKRPRANSDLDNRAKGILDLLAHCHAIDNDKDVMGLNMFWTADLPDGVQAEISIVQADVLEAA